MIIELFRALKREYPSLTPTLCLPPEGYVGDLVLQLCGDGTNRAFEISEKELCNTAKLVADVKDLMRAGVS